MASPGWHPLTEVDPVAGAQEQSDGAPPRASAWRLVGARSFTGLRRRLRSSASDYANRWGEYRTMKTSVATEISVWPATMAPCESAELQCRRWRTGGS